MSPDPDWPAAPDSTQLLNGLVRGDVAATDQLVAFVHAELRKLAARHMAGQRPDHTLQPTALVNEVWLRLFGRAAVQFEGRKQFYRYASRVMRSVLVDNARALGSRQRGEGEARLSISVCMAGTEAPRTDALDLLDLDAALDALQALDPELAHLVELRFFGGLSNAAVAEVLEVSERTVERQWRLARAYMHDELSA